MHKSYKGGPGVKKRRPHFSSHSAGVDFGPENDGFHICVSGVGLNGGTMRYKEWKVCLGSLLSKLVLKPQQI